MTSLLGRFDRSFAIRMIRDFLIALTAIVVLELGGRAALAWRDFQREDREATELAAERLASDVRDIMLNQGGPVAARTVYPILERNQRDLGFEIAIAPSTITVDAIRRGFRFEPRGIEADWSNGAHHEATVELRAEEFCLTCHTTATVGDVLGDVTVRSYRSHRMGEWWREARIISVVGMANVILHTIVLFLLLRLRMEPLLRLRSTVARLAKGRLDLTQRAVAKTDDEFGELAVDLNHFLDRVSVLLEELDGVLSKVVAVNERLSQVSGRIGKQTESVQAKSRSAMRHAVELRELGRGPSPDAIAALDAVLAGLDAAATEQPLSHHVAERLRDVVARFRETAARGQDAVERAKILEDVLVELSREVEDDTHYVGEILVLEERMKVVSEAGRALLGRLRLTTGEDVPVVARPATAEPQEPDSPA
jgi:HAMP domain-containing protein